MDLSIWTLGALVLLSSIGFGAYYYYDRYGHASQTVIGNQIQNIEGMIRENPESPELRVAAANFYLEGGQTDQAIRQSQQVLAVNSNNQSALVVLGQAYKKTGNLQGAIDSFKQVVELNKDNPLAKIDPRLEMVHYELGTLYAQQNKYSEAVASFKLALDINKTDADARYALGVVYQKKNEPANAVTEFQEAIRYIPDFSEAYSGLATSQAALGKVPEAKYAHAMAQLLQGQPANAAAQLEELIGQTPSAKYAYFGLGLAYEKLGRRDEAIRALQEFIKTNPNDIAAQQVLGRLNKGK
jgi:tetratricopeptide (TPR) repeat protein